MSELMKKPLFNPSGDTQVNKRRMIGGNTTNLNDFNNMKYDWVSDWYRQAMNNFWIPEEINMGVDIKDYRKLPQAERRAYDKILSFLIFLDSIQTANLPNIGEYITANEVNLCLSIQTFQEAVHSQSYSYMLDTICEPQERNDVLYQWKEDQYLLKRNEFIGNLYNEFQKKKDAGVLVKTLVANYMLEGIYFTADSCSSIIWEGITGCPALSRRSDISIGMRIPICGCSAISCWNLRKKSRNYLRKAG